MDHKFPEMKIFENQIYVLLRTIFANIYLKKIKLLIHEIKKCQKSCDNATFRFWAAH